MQMINCMAPICWLLLPRRRPATSAFPGAAAAAEAAPAFGGRRVESEPLEYSRPAFTPPAVLDTPVPGRPDTAMAMAAGAAVGFGAAAGAGGYMREAPQYNAREAAAAYSAAPTPVPPSRPPSSPSGAGGVPAGRGRGREVCPTDAPLLDQYTPQQLYLGRCLVL